ncbi:MAG: hypothetical protein ACPG4Z_08195 [Chitinophagales bacterium]
MKKRLYHYFFEDNTKQNVSDKLEIADLGTLFHKDVEIDCYDRFNGELEMYALPIKYLHHVDKMLVMHNLTPDIDNFFQQVKEVVAVAEKHQDEKGKEGKMNFQAYFHDVPASIESINDKAVVVFALAPSTTEKDAAGRRLYKLAGYVHANEFDFAPTMDSEERLPGYYYNMLRISEEEVNGQQVYRRSGVFSTMFGILLNLVIQNDIHFVYATMGKANAKINKALKKLAENYDKKWDILPTISNSKITLLHGRTRYKKQLIDITDNDEQLEVLYNKSQAIRGKYMFNQYPDFKDFLHSYKRIVGYSKTTKAFMRTDANGNMTAACIAVNWGDYFSFLLDNPKGIFVLVDKLKLTDQLLYAWLTVGEPSEVDKLYKGLSQYYKDNVGIKMFILNSYEGDVYKEVKSSFVDDPMNYFVIYDRPEQYEQFKEYSKDADGNIRIFIDTPML